MQDMSGSPHFNQSTHTLPPGTDAESTPLLMPPPMSGPSLTQRHGGGSGGAFDR